jgi:hypothetical protein
MLDMRQGTCPVCDHREIIEAELLEFSGEDDERQRSLAVTHGHDPGGFFSGPHFRPNSPKGTLKQYVCRSCGYVQWFAERPGEIPIGQQYRTRLINGPEATPYRR